MDKKKCIGIFDSGVGGLSILGELIKIFPEASFFYYSDDAHAPYGTKSDSFITERTKKITEELLLHNLKLIVVACNTATATSIDELRAFFPAITFVGVEPYLNAFYKESLPAKMVVLTTESTGKTERFRRLKERLDPTGIIDHFPLKNLARLIEEFYYNSKEEKEFEKKLNEELFFLKNKNYTHAILGCTHYPLIKDKIEKILNLKALSPCAHVAERAKELSLEKEEMSNEDKKNVEPFFYFYSSKKSQWEKKERKNLLGPFKI